MIIAKLLGENCVRPLPLLQKSVFTLMAAGKCLDYDAKSQCRLLCSWFRALRREGEAAEAADPAYDYWGDFIDPMQDRMQLVLTPEEFRLWEDLCLCVISRDNVDETLDTVTKSLRRNMWQTLLKDGVRPIIPPTQGRLP